MQPHDDGNSWIPPLEHVGCPWNCGMFELGISPGCAQAHKVSETGAYGGSGGADGGRSPHRGPQSVQSVPIWQLE